MHVLDSTEKCFFCQRHVLGGLLKRIRTSAEQGVVSEYNKAFENMQILIARHCLQVMFTGWYFRAFLSLFACQKWLQILSIYDISWSQFNIIMEHFTLWIVRTERENGKGNEKYFKNTQNCLKKAFFLIGCFSEFNSHLSSLTVANIFGGTTSMCASRVWLNRIPPKTVSEVKQLNPSLAN